MRISEVFVLVVGGLRLALPPSAVVQIAAPPALVPLPLTPPHLPGVVLLGQHVLPVVDLTHLLGLTRAAGEDNGGRLVVVRADDLEAALRVESIPGIRRLESAGQDPTGFTVGTLGRFVEREFETPEGLVGLLRLGEVLNAARL